MSDIWKAKQATPSSSLEQQIMDPNVPKNEREWWAAEEIERLRAALEPFARAAANFDTLKAFQDPEQFFAYSGIRSKRGVTGYISVAHLRLARATLEGRP
jgi:hypothetical protein